MKKNSSASIAEPIARRLAAEQGLQLIDVELSKESAGRFLRFFIEREGGVTLDDCERFHKAIQPMMESIDYDYMEVSSPGADRPFREREEFERAIGTAVEVKLYRAVAGAKRYVGTLLAYDGEALTLQPADDAREAVALPMKLVSQVAPLIEYDEKALEEILNGPSPEEAAPSEPGEGG